MENQIEKTEKKQPADKLAALKAEQEKRLAAVAAAEQKAKIIADKIAAEEKKRHDKDVKQLDGLCKKLKIDLADVIALVQLISDNNLTVKDVSELIEK